MLVRGLLFDLGGTLFSYARRGSMGRAIFDAARGLEIDATAMKALMSGEFLNTRLLDLMSRAETMMAARTLMDDLQGLAEVRAENHISEASALEVLRKRFCSLPPWCKG